MARVTAENVHEVMTYHPPQHANPNTPKKYKNIETAAEAFARVILDNAPECADRSEALRMVRLAKMWANSSVALDGLI